MIRFGTFTIRPLQIAEELDEDTFEGKFEDKHHAIEVFNRHNEEVKRLYEETVGDVSSEEVRTGMPDGEANP